MKKSQHDSQSVPKILGDLSLVVPTNCIFTKKSGKGMMMFKQWH